MNKEQANHNAIFRKRKTRKALQRGSLDCIKDALVHHVGSSPRPMAAEVRIDKQRICA